MTTSALQPSRRAASATPCAWLLALEQHLVAEPRRQPRRRLERRLDRDVVDARGQDLLQVARRLERALGRILASGGRHARAFAGRRLRQRIIRVDTPPSAAAGGEKKARSVAAPG